MKTLAVIPARIGATRLPRKPLRLLAGVPLVLRVWERVSAMRSVDRCVIATDSADIAAVAEEAGAECALTAAGHASGTDRVAEVARMARYAGYDVIVNVQGDEPFVGEEAVARSAALVAHGGFQLGTAASQADPDITHNPDIVKVVAADDGRALYFSRAPIPYLRDPDDPSLLSGRVLQHIGVYSYSPPALFSWVSLPPHPLEMIEKLEQLRPLAAGMPMGVAIVGAVLHGGIDTEEDLARANEAWARFTAEKA